MKSLLHTGRPLSLKKGLALLCVFLVLFIGAAGLLHSHAATEAANPACGLCAVAHLTVILTPALAAPVVAEALTPIAVSTPTQPPPRTIPFHLYVRPPPVLTILA